MRKRNKHKQIKYAKKHYLKNKKVMKKRAILYKDGQRKRLRSYVNELKTNCPCKDCGIQYPHYVLEFDHIIGIKHNNIADMVNRAHSLDNLKKEIAKCEIVCSNCHRERTFKRRSQIKV